MDYSLTVPNLINHFNKIKDNFGNTNTSDKENQDGGGGFAMQMLIFMIIAIIGLYIWAIVLLCTLNLEPIIKIICIVFLFFGQPIISIILAIIFNQKNI